MLCFPGILFFITLQQLTYIYINNYNDRNSEARSDKNSYMNKASLIEDSIVTSC
jgi:hypothetical protein